MTGSLPYRAALTPEDLHVFLISTDQVPAETLAAMEGLLSAEDKQRIAQLRSPHKRIESLLARASLRQILGHFLNTPAPSITLSTTPHGKPFLKSSRICFNLSHTTGMVLIGIAFDHELGVDIETFTRTSPSTSFDFEALSDRFFTRAEHMALLSFPPAERLCAFYRCWTRKEALLKGTGLGITGLKTVEVPLYPLPSPIPVSTPSGNWTLHDLSVPAPYIASVAIDSPNPRLHQWAIPAGENLAQ